MSKPVDLVVANIMHEAVSLLDVTNLLTDILAQTKGKRSKEDKMILDAVARKLLCSISHECSIATVLAALEAIKAPSTLAMISEGLQAVKDKQ